MKKNVISKEQAEKEFGDFVEWLDLDMDTSDWDEKDSEVFEKQFKAFKDTIVKASMSGRVIYSESGEPVFTPRDGKPITLKEITGAALMAGGEKNNPHARDHAIMAEMTGVPAGTFAKMPNRDLKVLRAFLSLFMG